MKKVIIRLDPYYNEAHVIAGALGSGKVLFSKLLPDNPTADDWRTALKKCKDICLSQNFELIRIEGLHLSE